MEWGRAVGPVDLKIVVQTNRISFRRCSGNGGTLGAIKGRRNRSQQIAHTVPLLAGRFKGGTKEERS
jgi:hypothetical protein